MGIASLVESRDVVVSYQGKETVLPPEYQSSRILSLCIGAELDAHQRNPIGDDVRLRQELMEAGAYTLRARPLIPNLPINILDPRVLFAVTAAFIVANR